MEDKKKVEVLLPEGGYIADIKPEDVPDMGSEAGDVIKIRETPPLLDNGATMLNIISQAALNPEVDIAKMQALMDMKDKYDAGEAKKAFAVDFCMIKLPQIKKTKFNKHTKSNYADLGDVLAAIQAPLRECGFGVNFDTSQTDKDVTATAKLMHRGGHIDTSTITMPIDNKGSSGVANKTVVHGIASALSYAKRNALCAVLSISLGLVSDDDGNAATLPQEAPLVNDNQAEVIKAAIMNAPAEIQDWFRTKYYAEGDVTKVRLLDFQTLVNSIKNPKLKEDKITTTVDGDGIVKQARG